MKEKMKIHADNKNHAEEPSLKLSDRVLVKQRPSNKSETPFKPQPYEVVDVKGTMITASNPTHKITRNVSFFKKISDNCGKMEPEMEEMDEEDDESHAEEVNEERMEANDTPAPVQNSNIIRRSQRDKKRPVYLKDYVKMISAD